MKIPLIRRALRATFSRKREKEERDQHFRPFLPSPLAGEGIMRSVTDEGSSTAYSLMPTAYSPIPPPAI